MGAFDHFPYTNFHELNLNWILSTLQEIQTTMNQFVAINSLKYADPIGWDITSQYEKNTIVIDPQTGTAYISSQAVPIGVSISDTDYWSVVFDLSSFVIRAAKNLANTYEDKTTLTATISTGMGGWIVWGETLYRALTNITAGDAYIVNGNIEPFTVEDVAGHLDDLNTTDKSNLVAAINELLLSVGGYVGDLNDLNTTDKSSVVAAINEVLSDVIVNSGDITSIQTDIGNLASLNTVDKSNVVAAINEVLATIQVEINATVGDLADLTTTDKSSVVNAINELENTVVNNPAVEAYSNPTVVYVAAVSGDDSWDGQSGTPFKTLDRALELLNHGVSSLYIYIKEAATYYITKEEIGGITLHIFAMVDGVRIEYNIGNVSGKFYNCHLNFQCQDAAGYLTIDNPNFSGFTGWYSENTATSFTRVKIPCGWVSYGGNIAFTDIEFNSMWLWSTSGFIQNCIIDNDKLGYSALWIRNNCNISIANTVHHNNTLPANNTHGMIRIERSIVRFLINNANLLTGDSTMTYKYQYGISGSNSIIEIYNQVLFKFEDFSYNSQNGTLDGFGFGGLIPFQMNSHESAYLKILANSDLNDFVTCGQFRTLSAAVSQTVSNTPWTASGFRLDVISVGSPSHLWQVVTALESKGLYIRKYDAATQIFGDWMFITNTTSVDYTAVPETAIPANSDLNTYLTHGYYKSTSSSITASLSHCPYTGSGFKLVVTYMANASHVQQQIFAPQLQGYYMRNIVLNGGVIQTVTNWFKIEGTDTGS